MVTGTKKKREEERKKIMEIITKLYMPDGRERVILKDKPKSVPGEVTVFVDKKQTSVSWRNDFRVIKEVQKVVKENDPTQEEATVNAPLDNPDLPCLVWFPSDKHIGSTQVDYDLLQRHTELVIKTPNCFEISIGDDIDNGIWGSLCFEQALPPQSQGFLVADMAAEMGGRNERGKQITLARVTGNHTDWTFEQAGQGFEAVWYGSTPAPILPGMGLVHLNIGSQTYEIAMAHRFKFKSALNPTNNCKRLLDFEYPTADLAIIGHEHVAEILEFQKGGKRRIGIHPGCYKLHDMWARKQGISGRGEEGGACVLFSPKEHKMIPFMKLDDGVEYLNCLTKIYEGRVS
jgi:hypothetical protein